MSDADTLVHHLRGKAAGSTRYLRSGQGDPVILIHGVGMASSIWAPQLAALSTDFDVIAYDMLGHGGSSLPPENARLSDYSDQLLSLIEVLGLQRPQIVGHSMGALVALEFALTHPTRPAGVTALNAVYCRTAEQRNAVLGRAEALERAGELGSHEGTIARWFGNPVPTELTREADLVHSLLTSVDPLGYSRTYRLFAQSDEVHKGRLEGLAVPALFMTGEFDPNSSPAMSQAMAEAAPQGRCEIIPRVRHMMALTDPDEVNIRLKTFVASVSRGQGHNVVSRPSGVQP
ncbi:alpha/beta fold hydrolase [Microvirga sp. TS319]|uniref:alpha/beta fold hydrolase n=1 Tax=Microvirga sp. TS319 TaxID=3241165 RepID=UPI00351A017C